MSSDVTAIGKDEEYTSRATSTGGEEEKKQKEEDEGAVVVEEEDRDEEGLLLRYDVCICGTGLVQSILASALSRIGKTVLHADGADYYGELDTVWTLPFLRQTVVQNDKSRKKKNNTSTIARTAASANDNADVGKVTTSNGAVAATTIALAPTGAMHSLRIHSMEIKTDVTEIAIGTELATPYGKAKVAKITMSPLTPSSGGETTRDVSSATSTLVSFTLTLCDWTLANDAQARIHVNVLLADDEVSASESHRDVGGTNTTTRCRRLAEALEGQHGIVPTETLRARRILEHQSRSLALDVTPHLLFCSGSAVEGMIRSGVSEYLEFKSIEGLLWHNNSNTTTTTTTTASSKNSNGKNKNKLERVPCSKQDVYKTSLIKGMEKRNLMKFLQLAFDYGTAKQQQQEQQQQQQQQAEDASYSGAGGGKEATDAGNSIIQSLNERHLNQGRSLARPQNKAVATNDLEHLERCIRDGTMDFDSYLKEKKLSPSSRALVRHALALESTSASTRTATRRTTSVEAGMKQLCRHMQALGRYGSTAFLVPMYGSGECAQAFCRSAAVYGATYLLRRAPLAIHHGSTVDDDSTNNGSKDSNKNNHNGSRVQGILLDADHHRHHHDGDNDGDGDDRGEPQKQRSPKTIRCSHVICPRDALLGARSTRRVLRRISVLTGGKLISSADNDNNNNRNGGKEQRHAMIIPPGSLGPNQVAAVHGLLLDYSVRVAPPNCTLLHLTTVVERQDAQAEEEEEEGGHEEAIYLDLLQKALDGLLAAAEDTNVREIFQVSFSYDLYDDDDDKAPLAAVLQDSSAVDGLHLFRRPAPSLAVDDAFDQAAALFRKICPDHDGAFLAMSRSVKDAVQERLGNTDVTRHIEQDDDRMLLESAMSMITTTTTASTTSTATCTAPAGTTAATAAETNHQTNQEQPRTDT